MDTTIVVALLAGLIVGLVVGVLIGRRPTDQRPNDTTDVAALRRQLQESVAEAAASKARLESERDAFQQRLESERHSAAEHLALLQSAREELTHQFKALAADILDEKSKKFTDLNQQELSKLLTPLHTELAGFKERVETLSREEHEGRIRLHEQVRQLTELNGTLRDETTNLTKALKGDSKAQGDWGEMVLERMLEGAGLIEGEHYRRQDTQRDDDGQRKIPDVVLLLPQDRTLVVDSKVSLSAYSQFVATDTPDAQSVQLRAHLDSVRVHIKGLGEKRYETLYGISSPDFVVMFMPIEGAFMTAVTSDRDLFKYAWDRNVLLVSPSTLLAVVRTIAQIWRQEQQNRSTQLIVERGARLYDKFVGFAEDLLKVGESLTRAQSSYEAAKSKLTDGSGNLVRQVEMLRELGVNPQHQLPRALTDAAGDDEEGAP
jgi:DNA recombination protein RmuC